MLETLIDMWTESLIAGERIELENLFVPEVRTIDRGDQPGELANHGTVIPAPRIIQRIVMRVSKHLRTQLNSQTQ